MNLDKTYLLELKQRAKASRAYKKYQFLGLEVAQILGDERHKSLYIKLAKDGPAEGMRRLARDIADRKNVRNKGAYFMKLWTARGKNGKNRVNNR